MYIAHVDISVIHLQAFLVLSCLQYKAGHGLVGVASLLQHLTTEIVCWECLMVPEEVEKVWQNFHQLKDVDMRYKSFTKLFFILHSLALWMHFLSGSLSALLYCQ